MWENPIFKYHSTILGGADMGGCYEVDCVLGYKGFIFLGFIWL